MALLEMLLLALAALALGRWMGGADRQVRLTTALVTALRNPGLALLLASRYGQHLDRLRVWILVDVLLVTLVVSTPLVRRSRHLLG